MSTTQFRPKVEIEAYNSKLTKCQTLGTELCSGHLTILGVHDLFMFISPNKASI